MKSQTHRLAKAEGRSIWALPTCGCDAARGSAPSGQRTRSGQKRAIVIDEVLGNAYDAVTHVQFGPNGKRLAYVAIRAGKEMVVVDGVATRQYDSCRNLLFGDPASLHFIAIQGEEVFRVEVEIEEND